MVAVKEPDGTGLLCQRERGHRTDETKIGRGLKLGAPNERNFVPKCVTNAIAMRPENGMNGSMDAWL